MYLMTVMCHCIHKTEGELVPYTDSLLGASFVHKFHTIVQNTLSAQLQDSQGHPFILPPNTLLVEGDVKDSWFPALPWQLKAYHDAKKKFLCDNTFIYYFAVKKHSGALYHYKMENLKLLTNVITGKSRMIMEFAGEDWNKDDFLED
jgi:hypothetical protein